MNMNMTHYMGLLAGNQPWDLIIFMAIPVIWCRNNSNYRMFLVVAHVAMIFGMVDPALGSGGTASHDMMNM